jgi:hypothetical protein
LHGKDAHAKNEGQSQQSYGYSLRHCAAYGTPGKHDTSDAASNVKVSIFISRG